MLQKPIIKGLLLSICCLLSFALIGSLLYTYGPLPTNTLSAFSLWLLFISLLFGAILSSKTAGCRGLFYGLSVTLSLVLILALFGFVLRMPGALSLQLLPKLFLAFLAGIIGGIIGIGLSNRTS
jgi:putative membrane protein (TIGR04086 family)